MKNKYTSIRQDAETYIEIKKSKFYGYILRIKDLKEVEEKISELRVTHKKAGHFCYGAITPFNIEEKVSDDGEPTGTAGLPILNQIKGAELSGVVIIVVRYFGGIKLGKGGLIRAYGDTARQCLAKVSFIEIELQQTKHIFLTYKILSNIQSQLTEAEITQITPKNNGMALQLHLSDARWEKILTELKKINPAHYDIEE